MPPSETTRLVGRLTISLDLPQVDARLVLSEERTSRARVQAAIDLLNQYRIASTVAIPDPESMPDVAKWTAAGHEIALLAEASWSQADSPRGIFARELASRVMRAGAKGLQIRTLALTHANAPHHTDLLVKHGIQGIRGVSSVGRRSVLGGLFQRPRSTHSRTLRYGLCEITAMLAATDVAGLSQFQRLVSQIKVGESLHVTLAPAAIFAHKSGVSRLEKALRFVQQQVAAGKLATETCQQCAARVLRPTRAAPARSILRIAA